MKKTIMLCAIVMGMMTVISCGNKTSSVSEDTDSISTDVVDTTIDIFDTIDVSAPIAESVPVEEKKKVDLRSVVVGIWGEDGCHDDEITHDFCWEFKSNGTYVRCLSSEATWVSDTGKWKLKGNKVILDGGQRSLSVDENGPIDENGHQMKRMHSLPVPEDQIYDQTNCEEPGI